MSDGMRRELVYLSSHATNRYFIPNWGIFIYFLCFHNDKFFRGLESKVEAHGDGAALRIDTIVDTQRSGSCAVAR